MNLIAAAIAKLVYRALGAGIGNGLIVEAGARKRPFPPIDETSRYERLNNLIN